MSTAVSRGLALDLMAKAMQNTDWDSLDGELLQREVNELKPEEIGSRFTAFLRNNARLVIAGPKILRPDSSLTFNPTEFVGQGWTAWKGPADGDGLTGKEAIDSRAPALTEIDFSKVL